jgi:hypothetical protein
MLIKRSLRNLRSLINEVLEPRGYVARRQIFVRTVDPFLQILSLEKSSSSNLVYLRAYLRHSSNAGNADEEPAVGYDVILSLNEALETGVHEALRLDDALVSKSKWRAQLECELEILIGEVDRLSSIDAITIEDVKTAGQGSKARALQKFRSEYLSRSR